MDRATLQARESVSTEMPAQLEESLVLTHHLSMVVLLQETQGATIGHHRMPTDRWAEDKLDQFSPPLICYMEIMGRRIQMHWIAATSHIAKVTSESQHLFNIEEKKRIIIIIYSHNKGNGLINYYRLNNN